MNTSLTYLQVRKPGDFNDIRGFIGKNKALGIEGYERIKDSAGQCSFMLGYADEKADKPTFVAGIRTEIWEFAPMIEDRIRKALGMGR